MSTIDEEATRRDQPVIVSDLKEFEDDVIGRLSDIEIILEDILAYAREGKK